jgi:hypothetical protein
VTLGERKRERDSKRSTQKLWVMHGNATHGSTKPGRRVKQEEYRETEREREDSVGGTDMT